MTFDELWLQNSLEKLTGFKVFIHTNPIAYAKQMKATYGSNYLSMTDSGYPTPLAMGYCSYRPKEVVILKIGNWKQRLAHEVGHVFKHPHTQEKGNIMHPWGIYRGWNGANVFLPPEILKELMK